MIKAMLIDTSACLSCNACTVECKRENNVPLGRNIAWTKMLTFEAGQYPQVKQYYMKKACNHCTEAACVENCPVSAISHLPDGSVVIDQEKCIGCGMCVRSCPFGVPQIDEEARKSNKCTFCVHRTTNGGETACSMACPFGAITFGERSEMLRLGKERVAALQGQGNDKTNLYGETQMGGLHVLYVLEDSPSAYGLPEVSEQSAGTVLAGLWNKIVNRESVFAPLTTIALVTGLVIKNREARLKREKEAEKA